MYTRAHPSFSYEDREKEDETGDTHNKRKKLRPIFQRRPIYFFSSKFCLKTSLEANIPQRPIIRKIRYMHDYDVYEAVNLNVNLMIPGSGVQALGQGQYGHIVKMY